jgi:hypothetical protein
MKHSPIFKQISKWIIPIFILLIAILVIFYVKHVNLREALSSNPGSGPAGPTSYFPALSYDQFKTHITGNSKISAYIEAFNALNNYTKNLNWPIDTFTYEVSEKGDFLKINTNGNYSTYLYNVIVPTKTDPKSAILTLVSKKLNVYPSGISTTNNVSLKDPSFNVIELNSTDLTMFSNTPEFTNLSTASSIISTLKQQVQANSSYYLFLDLTGKSLDKNMMQKYFKYDNSGSTLFIPTDNNNGALLIPQNYFCLPSSGLSLVSTMAIKGINNVLLKLRTTDVTDKNYIEFELAHPNIIEFAYRLSGIITCGGNSDRNSVIYGIGGIKSGLPWTTFDTTKPVLDEITKWNSGIVTPS